MRYRSLCGVIVITCIIAAPAWAASDVSPKFDGVYLGAAAVVSGMGVAACAPFDVGEVTISRGFVKPGTDAALPRISGFITEEGYLAAVMTRSGRPTFPLEGRLEDGVIVAGFIDTTENCYWTVHLRRR